MATTAVATTVTMAPLEPGPAGTLLVHARTDRPWAAMGGHGRARRDPGSPASLGTTARVGHFCVIMPGHFYLVISTALTGSCNGESINGDGKPCIPPSLNGPSQVAFLAVAARTPLVKSALFNALKRLI